MTDKKKSSGAKKSPARKPVKELEAYVPKRASRTTAAAQRSKAPAKKETRRPKYEHADEIAGVILIALGLVAGILTYFNTAAIFESVVRFLFGLMGIVQYAVPVLLVVMGVMLIFMPKRQFGTGLIVMLLFAVFFVSCVIHTLAKPIGELSFGEYLSRSFEMGRAGSGCGWLAAIPVFGLVKLISSAGAIVVFIALALVLILLATHVSIRSAGQKIVAKVDAMEDRRKARLIDERVGDDTPVFARRPKKPDLDEEEPPISRRKKHERREEKKAETGLEFIPNEGKLPKKKKKDEQAGPLDDDRPPFDGEITEYDPFETIEIVPEDNITGETVVPKVPAIKAAKQEREKAEAAAAPSNEEERVSGGAEDIGEPAAVAVYQKPPITLLRQADISETIANDSPKEKAKLLLDTLKSFNINATLLNISVGPVITRFEIQPAPGTRVNRITALSNDIALALAAPRVRIEAPIPGKAAVGIEIPNKDTAMVRLREVIDTREFYNASSPLTFALGKDIAGKPVYANLEKMPHMLIAGATGSGKSVCINSIILSTLYKASPDEVRMILIDPKVVELSIFAPVPHLYCPVVTDPKKAAGVLKWACNEMDQRYSKMSKINARDLARYNALQENEADRMPRLMIIIDELADLMIVSAKDVEESIARLAQLGRACGIHLIVATQRPSVDVITGLIKTNIPSRIAFAVSSAIDSRVILDGGGAEKLLGHGDMLFHPNGAAKPTRAQGAYVSDEEVESIMQFFIDNQVEVPKNNSVLESIPDLTAPTGQGNGKQEDDLLPDAVRIVMDSGSASISMIQRRLRVGYARAARLVDIMEQHKIVSGFDGSKPRKVLIDEAGYAEMFGGGYAPAGAPDEIDGGDED